MTVKPLPLADLVVLGLIGHVAPRAISGYDLHRFATASVGYIWAPSKSQLYVALGRLLDQGLASRREVRQSTRPDKQLYRITTQGRRVLREWLDREDEGDDPDASVFVLKYFFGRSASRQALVAQLRLFRDLYAERLADYEEIERAAEPPTEQERFTLATLRYGIARARAAVEWADRELAGLDVSPRARLRPSGSRASG